MEEARRWTADKMRKAAEVLRELDEGLEVTARVHVGDPTGSVSLELEITGTPEEVAEALGKLADVVEK